jgi:pimeloyl-ACP methyl ester carboxylesterase
VDFAVVDGVRLGYERMGDGDPVVLAAGTGMPPAAWDLCGLRRALVDAGHEVITFAARGVAPSDAPAPPYSISNMTADLVGLLTQLDIPRCALVGYSLGGFVAEHLVRTRPDLLTAVVLLASAGPLTPVLRAALETETALIAELGHLPAAYARYETLHSTLPPAVLRDDPATTAAWWELLAAQEASWTSPHGACGQSAAAHAWAHDADRVDQLRKIVRPVLVVAFEHDLFFPPSAGRAAAELLPRGEFVEVPDAAHGGLMTHPKDCTHALLPFLDRHRAVGS